MITPEELSLHPRTAEAWAFLGAKYTILNRTLEYILTHFDAQYLRFSEDLFSFASQRPGGLEKALCAFIRYSNEYLVLQARLNKEGKYLHSSYAEVNRTVYQGDVMDRYYLDGLLLSQPLWPNHYRMGLYFQSCLAKVGPAARVLDVPTGPGCYSLLLARHLQFDSLDAFDISPHAIEYASQLLTTATPSGRVNCRVGNVLELEPVPTYDMISCGELLEHLEQPQLLLAKLRALLKPGGTIFLTTAIFAAAIDHIFLLRNVLETQTLLREYFTIESELILPVTLEEYHPGMDRVPINYACVLR